MNWNNRWMGGNTFGVCVRVDTVVSHDMTTSLIYNRGIAFSLFEHNTEDNIASVNTIQSINPNK